MPVPLHIQSSRSFHTLSPTYFNHTTKQANQQFKDTLDFILEDPDLLGLENSEKLLSEFTDVYQEIQHTEAEMSAFNKIVNSNKKLYKEKSDACEEVTFNNWDNYMKDNLEAPSIMSIIENIDLSKVNVKHKNDIYNIISLLWNDPQCVLPSLNDDDNDLIIEGGKIELVCPITVKQYVNPMISKKCSHTFDEEGLKGYFTVEDRPKECPQDGCSQILSNSDFIPDPIMKLRIKLFELRKDTIENDDNLDFI